MAVTNILRYGTGIRLNEGFNEDEEEEKEEEEGFEEDEEKEQEEKSEVITEKDKKKFAENMEKFESYAPMLNSIDKMMYKIEKLMKS
jgi:hypothetical protein